MYLKHEEKCLASLKKKMLRQSTILILVLAAFTGCQNRKAGLGSASSNDQSTPTGKLETRLSAEAGNFSTDSVQLTFTVVNHADSVQRFVRWETPFEPRLGKYLEVKDENGQEAEFKGAMARRVMPPPAEAYIEVPAHDSLSTRFNVATNYTLSEGLYTIKYVGGGVSGLDAGKEIKIKVAKP